MTLVDAQARARATDPMASFIVQAPAGSGKTEILTQRFLRLLSVVNEPEHIVALTFTRKAAQEMRERIILSIRKAEAGVVAQSQHEHQTLTYAKAVLERSRERNWQLSHQGARLRIMTIDALCQNICHAMPLQDNQLPFAELSVNPEKHYLNAAKNTVLHAFDDADYQQEIECLLLHQDNKMPQLIHLFCQLLQQRDQWLPLVLSSREFDREYFEQTLSLIQAHRLEQLHQSIPSSLYQELIRLARIMADIDINDKIDSHILRTLDASHALDLKQVKAIAKLLLKQSDGVLRKHFDHNVGLKKGVCTDELFYQIKQESMALLESLSAYPDFSFHLNACLRMPEPRYEDSQWEVLQAVFKLLLLLAAQMNLEFNDKHAYDFTAASQMALQAMGEIDAPSDLALYLDHSIQHLLIDEFQDTSLSQFSLIEHLVAGWQVDDGRTLFLVGDPMQSIYRFRQAEVGLFIRAQQHGVADVALTPLYLQCNFRSRPALIDWVSQQFPSVFPAQDDIESGAVRFHHAHAVLEEQLDTDIQAIHFEDNEQEADFIVHQVQQQLQLYPNDHIAVLVRSRSMLSPLIKRFRSFSVEWQGSDIAKLKDMPHIMDVYSLTQILNNPASRLPWLSLMRSPFVGMNMADISQFAEYDQNATVAQLMQKDELLTMLSPSGQLRLRWFWHIIKQHLDNRMQNQLSFTVLHCWRDLHGDLLSTPEIEADLERYWQLLEQHEENGLIEDITLFEQALADLYSEDARQSRVQIMTIHKSKGLEFDTVFLPGLNQRPKDSDKHLLRWLRLPEQNQELILVSPMRSADEQSAPIYDFIGDIDKEKSDFEMARLLYVAVTRAKKRLFLTASGKSTNNRSFKSMLSKANWANTPKEQLDTENTIDIPQVYTLADDYYQQLPERFVSAYGHLPEMQDDSARHLGILSHLMMQYLADKEQHDITSCPWYLIEDYCRMNALFDQQEELKQKLAHIIESVLQDQRGQWILANHAQSAVEQPLLSKNKNVIETKILDRTFIEDGIRWIIDYKTGQPSDEKMKLYQQQVNGYAAIFRKIEDIPITCALYFLDTTQWISWSYE